MFYFLFLLPFCIAVFLRALHNEKTKKYALTFACIVLGIITLSSKYFTVHALDSKQDFNR